MMVDSCLKINKGFSDAWNAIKKLETAGKIDWYDWWFRKVRSKKIIGGILIALYYFLLD